MNEPALTINQLTVAYTQEAILWRVNATIPRATLTAIAGPNGAGKSTLLKTIVTLLKPTSGSITVLGKDHRSALSHIAYIPQRATIDWDFPMHVLDVVVMGTYTSLGWFTRPGKKEYHRALAALDAVGMYNYAHTPINQLSGGQQQRMFIARALVQDADIYLMDEPLSGVDTSTQQVLLQLLGTVRSRGKTIVMVHHDLHTISTHFDWVFLLNRSTIACATRADACTRQHLTQAYGPSLIIP